MNHTIAIIGAGNMGASLAGGLIKNDYPADKIWITDLDTKKLQYLQNEYHIHTSEDNQQTVSEADVIILAVKPQILADVTTALSKTVQAKKPLVISIAAGCSENNIQTWLGGHAAIVRAMPNTPALIGCGATALFANQYVTEEQKNTAESILRSVSLTVWISDEKLMDAITALSGSGPAYFFLVIEAMQNAAMELGLPEDIARVLTLQTAYGAGRMALESDVDAAELRARVTSPGGTTEQAVRVLEENHIRDIFKKALLAAEKRSKEMAK